MGYPTYEIEGGVKDLDYLAQLIHENAAAKGFWDGERNFGEMLMLIVSEAAEALEAHRNGEPIFHVVDGKPEGVLVELADILIRTLDTMDSLARPAQYSIDKIVAGKMNYNSTREHKHGKAY